MAALQRALPAHTPQTGYFDFTPDVIASDLFFGDETDNQSSNRPQPSEDLMDDTLADSFPASDPPAWY